jgi:hypothetical protein
MLWLQTLAHASEELGPMVFDYAGESNRDHPTAVNLVGLQRTYLTQILAFADAARLKPIAIHPTIFALAEATRSHAPDAICLSVRTDGAELAIKDASDVHLLRHVTSTPALPKLIAELKRNTIPSAAGSSSGMIPLWITNRLTPSAKPSAFPLFAAMSAGSITRPPLQPAPRPSH